MSKKIMDISEMQLAPKAAEKWEAFCQPPVREPEQRARGRAAFLSQVDAASRSRVASQQAAVVNRRQSSNARLDWRSILSAWQPAVIVLVVALVLIAGSTVVYAAQSSLPGELLYSIKTASENVRMDLAANNENRLQLTLEFSDRRVEEIAALSQSGQNVPEDVAVGLLTQLQNALRLAAGMDEQPMHQALVQIQQKTKHQQEMMLQIADQSDSGVSLVQSMLQQQYQLTAIGLADPARFRQQLPAWLLSSPSQEPVQPSVMPTDAATPGSQAPAAGPTAGVPKATSCGSGSTQKPGFYSTPQPGGSSTQNSGTSQAPGGIPTSKSPCNPSQPNTPEPTNPGGESQPGGTGGGSGEGQPGGTGGGGNKRP